MTKKVTVLGSTGSIGTQSLDVIRAQEYSVFGLAAHSNVELLLRQVQEFHPHCIAVVDDAAADRAARELHGMPGAPVLLRGKEGLEAVSYTHLYALKSILSAFQRNSLTAVLPRKQKLNNFICSVC